MFTKEFPAFTHYRGGSNLRNGPKELSFSKLDEFCGMNTRNDPFPANFCAQILLAKGLQPCARPSRQALAATLGRQLSSSLRRCAAQTWTAHSLFALVSGRRSPTSRSSTLTGRLPGCGCEDVPYHRGCVCFSKRGHCLEHCGCACGCDKQAPAAALSNYIPADMAVGSTRARWV